MKTLKELLDLVAAGDTNDLTAENRSLLLAHFEARREAAGDSPTAEDADLLDQILDAVEAINTQLSNDESAAAEGDESADGGEQDSSTEPDDSDEQDSDEGDEPAGEQDSTSEPDSEGEQDSTSSDEPASDEPASDSAEEGNPPELGDLADVDDRAADLVAAAAKQTDRTDARRRARLTRTRSNGAAPTATTPTALPPFVSLGVSTVAPAGSPVDAEQAGQLMRDAVMASRAQPVGTRTPVLRLDLGDKLAVAPKSGSEEDYATALQASLGIATKQFSEQATLQASGGPCAPPELDYTRTLIGGGDAGKFAASHPGVMTRRPRAFYRPEIVDVSAAGLPKPGVGIVTASQDEAGYGDPDADPTSTVPVGGVPFKSPVIVDCPPEPVSCEMSEIYQAVQSGRFIDLSFPEQVAHVRKKTAIYHAFARDRAFSDAYIAAGTNLNGGAALFGVSRDTLSKIRYLIASVRSNRGDQSLPFHVWGPAWFKNPVATDIAKSFTGATDLGPNTSAAIGRLAQDEGIQIDTYSHNIGTTINGSPSVLPNAALLADNSALPTWPTQARLIIAPVGAITRNTAGELSFGVESLGMATNDSLTFGAIFEAPCVVDPSAIFTLDVPVAELGGTGAMVDAS